MRDAKPSLTAYGTDPLRGRVEQLGAHRGIVSAARRHVEGMICVLEQPQGRAAPERLAHRLELVEFGERVACPLQEQHRDSDVGEMFGALGRRFLGGMHWKPEE